MSKMKIWAILLLLLGIACIIYPYMMHQKQEEEMKQLQKALEDIQETGKMDGQDPLNASLSLDEDDLYNTVKLYIPTIELNAPVLPKTTKEYLNIALTQIKKNQVPGQGNFTIAGHNSAVYGRHFNRLHELNIGDEIQLIDGEKVFIYQVDSKRVIDPSEVDILNDTPDKNEITLITCTVAGTKRLVVKGHRIS